MGCVGCGSAAVSERNESTAQGYRRFRCRPCGKQFNERSAGVLNRTQYPSDVIALVVLWRLRYKLALRDRPEMFLIRGIVFSHEAVRDWEAKLTPALAENLRRRRRGKAGRWYVDETYIKVHGHWRYLYRAIDRSGALVDVMFSEHREGVLRAGQDGHRGDARPGHHGWARQLSAGDPNHAGRRCAASQQPVSQQPTGPGSSWRQRPLRSDARVQMSTIG
jgi:DDE superfamily endonuclease